MFLAINQVIKLTGLRYYLASSLPWHYCVRTAHYKSLNSLSHYCQRHQPQPPPPPSRHLQEGGAGGEEGRVSCLVRRNAGRMMKLSLSRQEVLMMETGAWKIVSLCPACGDRCVRHCSPSQLGVVDRKEEFFSTLEHNADACVGWSWLKYFWWKHVNTTRDMWYQENKGPTF